MSGFVAIPTQVIRNRDLSLTARVLLGVVLSYGWTKKGCTASTETLCEDCGIGRTAFYEALQQLAAAGLVCVEKGHSSGRQRRIVPQVEGVRIPDFDEPESPKSGIRTGDSEVDEGTSLEVDDSLRSSACGVEPSEQRQAARVEEAQRAKLRAANGVVRLCDRLAELMTANDPKAKVAPESIRWMDAAEKLMRIDERHFEEALVVLEWSQRDPFWSAQILSMPKFREKYPQLRAKWALERSNGIRSAAAAPQASVADLVSAYERPRSRAGV